MNNPPQSDSLHTLLLDHLEVTRAKDVCTQLAEFRCETTVFELFDELGEMSSKVQGKAISVLSEMSEKDCLPSVVPWLDLGIVLTQSSGALGLRYFSESPTILYFVQTSELRHQLLAHVLELADESVESAPHCAYEWLKVLPELSKEHSLQEIQQWAELGMELARWNYVVGNEFFRESPAIVDAIPLESARDWIGFGMKLMVQNSLGKPDYLGTLEFFRASPNLFREITEPDVKQQVVVVGSNLADRSPEQAMTFLAEAPALLARLSCEDWKLRALKFGLLVVDKDVEAALTYFRQVPEVMNLQGAPEDMAVFDAWFGQGMEALDYSVEAGRAFFALETQQACAAVEEALTGVPLRQVGRSLKMFARAMCGDDVNIEPLPASGPSGGALDADLRNIHSERAHSHPETLTLYLPLMMKRSPTQEGNRRWYTVMVAHEVGHVEFGTYRVSQRLVHRLASNLQARYDHVPRTSIELIHTLGDLFNLYPQAGVIRDLWEVIEDARIDFMLKHEYPGLREDLVILTKEAIATRTLSHGMTAREIVLDAMLLHFSELTKDDFSRPGLQEVIDEVWEEAQTILHPHATADDALELADRVYQILELSIGSFDKDQDDRELETFPQTGAITDDGEYHEASEHLEKDYQSVENWDFRGILDPNRVKAKDMKQSEAQSQGGQFGGGSSEVKNDGGTGSRHESDHAQPEKSPDPQDARFGDSPLQRWIQPNFRGQQGLGGKALQPSEYLYPEWDGIVQDYRPQWCRVLEQVGVEGSPDFVDETFQTYGAMVRVIRRYFETIRPAALRRLGRQADGEDIDLDALVSWIVDRRQGQEPPDRVYATRQKHDRQVAVAFLVDMSGSTGRQIGSEARSVIDIEKEGLLLLAEAVSAIGDDYAIYGFSGQTRQAVDIHILKDFDHSPGGRVGLKISGIKPRQQNRDGTAIRHAVNRLMQQPAKVRLLVLLSDGKPLDDDYVEEYALEDTKMALREARSQAIHPFCITIDQSATDYVRRMYGDVGFLVVEDVESLPTRLPKIYQRLTTK